MEVQRVAGMLSDHSCDRCWLILAVALMLGICALLPALVLR